MFNPLEVPEFTSGTILHRLFQKRCSF